MECEICGKETEKTVKVEMDRSEFLVCENCAKFGRRLEQDYQKEEQVKVVLTRSTKKIREPRHQFTELVLIKDFGAKVRKAREKKGLTIKELAQKLFEKESYLQRVESQGVQPSDALIAKLEKFLGISLKEKLE